MRISDWSSDVCSSDLGGQFLEAAPPGVGDLTPGVAQAAVEALGQRFFRSGRGPGIGAGIVVGDIDAGHQADSQACLRQVALKVEATAVERVESGRELLVDSGKGVRSEEHKSELQSLMRISYAVFCLKKKNTQDFKSRS